MNIRFETFNSLKQPMVDIRTTVFVLEQGFKEEFDQDDNNCIQVLMFDGDKPIGTCRSLFSKEHNCQVIGRFAIYKEYRGQHLGEKMMSYMEQILLERFGHIKVGVSAQIEASGFYSKCGYKKTEERYLDQNHPHVFMYKNL